MMVALMVAMCESEKVASLVATKAAVMADK